MKAKMLMRAYFDAAHPMSPRVEDAKMELERDYKLKFIGPAVGGLASVPYDAVPDGLASMRRLPAMMGDEDALRAIFGLELVVVRPAMPKPKHGKRIVSNEE